LVNGQAQIERQAQDLGAARQGAKKASGEAAGTGGKLAAVKPPTVKVPKA
jgi:hypothetical protein